MTRNTSQRYSESELLVWRYSQKNTLALRRITPGSCFELLVIDPYHTRECEEKAEEFREGTFSNRQRYESTSLSLPVSYSISSYFNEKHWKKKPPAHDMRNSRFFEEDNTLKQNRTTRKLHDTHGATARDRVPAVSRKGSLRRLRRPIGP